MGEATNVNPDRLIVYPSTIQRLFGPCRKCWGTDIYIRYHDGIVHCKDCGEVQSCEGSRVCGDREGEHIYCHCRRCGFSWVENAS